MQSLAEVLKEFQRRHQVNNNANLAQVVQTISQDNDVRQFWQEHQDQLRPDAFERKLMDLYEFVQQKQRIAAGKKSLYPGYHPALGLEKGYPYVKYVADQKTQEAERQKTKLTRFHIPKAAQRADLQEIAASTGTDQNRADALTEVVRVLSDLSAGGNDNFVPGIYLSGDFGVGKTYLMGALANALAANDIGVLFIHFPSFINQLKASFNRPQAAVNDLVEQAKKVPVLIIDDIGADTLTAWSRDDVLAIILEYRMQNELTTCFTSNFDWQSLEQYLAQTRDGKEPGKAARLMQRIQFLSRPVNMAGPNRRLQS
ncbi:primosomal protein DnaI [Lactobacillaceae bacterium L1_55_11]|nr:primosomal protein DnaI [Lactobacillaceae bacterium L1_55_11]